jgi:hypothetical protein
VRLVADAVALASDIDNQMDVGRISMEIIAAAAGKEIYRKGETKKSH